MILCFIFTLCAIIIVHYVQTDSIKLILNHINHTPLCTLLAGGIIHADS